MLQTAFDLDNYAGAKDFVFKKAAVLARGWRSYLTKYFLRNADGEVIHTHPSELCHIITQKQWDQFVSLRASNEFIKVSKKNSKAAASNPYPYMRGRDGYAQIEQVLVC